MSDRPSFLSLALRSFWVLFGSIWLVVGLGFLIASAAALTAGADASRNELWIFLGLGAVFSAVGGFLVARNLRRAWYEWKVRCEGTAWPGVVRDVTETSIKINRQPMWRLHYDYRDFQGMLRQKSILIGRAEAMRWKAGDECTVLLASQWPDWVVWTGRRPGEPW